MEVKAGSPLRSAPALHRVEGFREPWAKGPNPKLQDPGKIQASNSNGGSSRRLLRGLGSAPLVVPRCTGTVNRIEDEDDGTKRKVSKLTGGESLNSQTTPSIDPITAGLH